MAHDSQRGYSVLFGGTTLGTPHGDTWLWNGNAWLPQLFASGPSARFGHAMAFDGQRGRTVMFGGTAGGGAYLSDTWEWDGSNWVQAATTGPASRIYHALVYDSQRGRSVLFGGEASGNTLGDTWEWNGATWALAATTGPSPRRLHQMAYDSQRGRTVLFGGLGFADTAWTWEWDGLAWTQAALTGPSDREGHSMAYDTQRGRTVLFGGSNSGPSPVDTWEWNGQSWTRIAISGPPARSFSAMAYDTQRNRVILFGGATVSGFPFGDTWEWNGYYTSTSTTYGSGCGNPALTLSPVTGGHPTINSTAQVALSNIPTSLAFIAIGWSRGAFGPFTLPLTLVGYGMPGCNLLQSSEFPAPALMTSANTATFSLSLPNWSGLIGLHLHLQGWSPAPGANSGNTIVSNGVEWAIGNS